MQNATQEFGGWSSQRFVLFRGELVQRSGRFAFQTVWFSGENSVKSYQFRREDLLLAYLANFFCQSLPCTVLIDKDTYRPESETYCSTAWLCFIY